MSVPMVIHVEAFRKAMADNADLHELLPTMAEHVNEIGPRGDAIVHLVAKTGFENLVKLLPPHSDLTLEDTAGETLISLALSHGVPLEGVEHILQPCDEKMVSKISEWRDTNGMSLLHRAAIKRDPGFARALLSKGISRWTVNTDGTPAFMIASCPSVSAAIINFWDPLNGQKLCKQMVDHMLNESIGWKSSVMKILAQGDFDPKFPFYVDHELSTELLDVCSLIPFSHHPEFFTEALLGHPTFMRVWFDPISTCFPQGVKGMEALEKILDAGADPSGNNPLPPLLSCVIGECNGYLQGAKMLLERGADPSCRDAEGTSPMHVAAISDIDECIALVNLLVEYGAHVDERDRLGRTPLRLAIDGSYLFNAAYLLSKGADPKIRALDEFAPQDLPAFKGAMRIIHDDAAK